MKRFTGKYNLEHWLRLRRVWQWNELKWFPGTGYTPLLMAMTARRLDSCWLEVNTFTVVKTLQRVRHTRIWVSHNFTGYLLIYCNGAIALMMAGHRTLYIQYFLLSYTKFKDSGWCVSRSRWETVITLRHNIVNLVRTNRCINYKVMWRRRGRGNFGMLNRGTPPHSLVYLKTIKLSSRKKSI